jgi:uncharacterized protein YdaU (DUF1376 family)
MAEFPALPLWTDAFVADTIHLSTEEIGAYMLLLFTAWRRPGCDLPDDDKFLASICRCDGRKWRHLRPVMLQFHTVDNGRWIQKRLQKERKYVDDLSKTQRENSLRRWNKNKDITLATAMPPQSHGNPPTPIPNKIEKQVSQNGGYARGRGAPPAGDALADDNLQKFMGRLAKELDASSAGKGWTIVASAANRDDPLHARCLLLCKAMANKIGKGWPFNWPKEQAVFDRIVTGGLSVTTEEQPNHDQQI